MTLPRSELTVDPALADACPSCHPGDVPAAAPLRVRIDDGALEAAYECAACGTAWRTWWELASCWPLRREPVRSVTALLGELIAALANLLEGEPLEPSRN